MVAASLLLIVAAPAAAAPPANDLFASAELLTGSSASVSGTNVEATKETGEPNHRGYSGGHSIWYRWVAPDSGTVVVDTSASSFYYTSVTAYTGLTVDGLTQVGTNDWYTPYYRLRFSAVAGRTYHFAVDGQYGETGTIQLSLNRSDPPANDPFANPEQLTGDTDSATGDTTNATREGGEPAYGYGAGSIWYEWTAPASGGVKISTAGSGYNTTLGVYTGDNVAGLVWVASNDNANYSTSTSEVKFNAVAGTTYRIQVDGYYSEDRGSVQLSLESYEPPPNDMFAAATALPSESVATAAGYNDGATAEPGEPSHESAWYYGAGRSTWYSWTAPKSGSLTVKTTASFQTVLAVYTGDSVAQLTRVVNQPQDWNGGAEQIRVRVEAGVTYRIVVDSYSYAYTTGAFSLSLNLIDSPDNDDFANADPIVGLDVDVKGSNVGATQEPCEPVHDDNYYDPSVWYEWTAPASGGVTLDTTGSEFNTVLGIYTGDTLCELSRVPTTRTSGPNVPAKRRFRAAAGVTYRIAVDGARARWGNFTLSLDYAAPPANDMFVAAEILSGEKAETTGDNIGATGENGEPNPGGTAGASVWYSWTAPKSGLAVVKLPQADFDAAAAAFTGDSVDALTALPASSADHYYRTFSFRAEAGTTYRIAIHGGSTPTRGEFSLTLEMFELPPNDDLANAAELTGSSLTADGTTAGATKEQGEPNHESPGSYYDYSPASVWYVWTAPTSGKVTFSTLNSETSNYVVAYTGSSFDAMTRIAGGYGYYGASFVAQAGTTYRIAVASYGSLTSGKFTLSIALGSPPNDNFADAEVLTGTSATATGSNRNATHEPGEPKHYYYGYAESSVWYSWTAPSDGVAMVDVSGSNFDTLHAVYTGSSIGELTLVGSQDSGPVTFEATAGTTYRIAVDSYSAQTGTIKLTVGLHGKPANDDFADAEELTGGSDTAPGSNVGGSREAGEPGHYWSSGAPSVWYRWTAPGTGSVDFWLSNYSFSPGIAIYQGSGLDSLSLITSSSSYASFTAQGGRTYYIAVDGYYSSVGNFDITLSQPWTDSGQVQDPPPQQEQPQDPPQQEQPQDPPPQEELQGPPQEERGSQPQPEQQQAPPPSPGDQPAWTPPASDASTPLSLSAVFPTQTLASVLTTGLGGAATCSKACSLEVVVTIDPATAKKAGLRGAKLTTARAALSGRAGTPARLTVKVPKAARAKLRRAKSIPLVVKITARAGGETDVVTQRLRIKR